MKHYKQQKPAMVGSYTPSTNFNKFTHFAVMEQDGTMLGTTGYFQRLQDQEPWDLDDYRHAFQCIEQAQLYAHAPQLFSMMQRLLVDPGDAMLQREAHRLLASIVNIDEPAQRLLGEDSLKVKKIL